MKKNIPMYCAHPWHGIPTRSKNNNINCFIEIVPQDSLKYEIDKDSGLLMIDRPQKFSNRCPSLYGLIPRTYSGKLVSKFCEDKAGLTDVKGDGDPLDVCVLTEENIACGNILLSARVIGGMRVLDGNESDDKIIAVLDGDPMYANIKDISDLQDGVLNRIMHYFLSYKESPDNLKNRTVPVMEILGLYGKDEADEIIALSQKDYENEIAN